MFFVITKIEQGSYENDKLQNPKNLGNPMVLVVFRQLTRTAIFSVHSKKAFGEFYDKVTQKKIAHRSWTPEMKSFANQKIVQAPKPLFIFKLTILGWIFIMLVITTFALIIYQEVKPPLPKSAEYVAMEQVPVAGNIYFGHYEVFKESGDRIASDIGFGWFKVVKVEGDTYYIAKSMQMNKTHKPKEELNSTDFESDGTATTITEQAGYMINMKAVDGKMEIYITDKK
ncbi:MULTISPECIES: hypothetical protein [Sphingobacterium]|uniref:hypothetical protein n=1 Tax=Sphingobacterium TaxID=28453 RepID=UPI00191A7D94|nr:MULTISPECIES: hypothetical protein [Sphingobacterium]QQT25357.1 hypothetical protein I6J02_16765 [Sphingobacterium spiritivorum]